MSLDSRWRFRAILVVSSVMVFAQVTKGTLRGTVTDPNGGSWAAPTVSAQNQNTGATTQTTTSSEGNYVLPEPAPGQYTVTVEATSGFSKKAIKDVTINLGQSTDSSGCTRGGITHRSSDGHQYRRRTHNQRSISGFYYD